MPGDKRAYPPLETEIPAGIQRHIPLRLFAAALGITERTARYWADEERLETLSGGRAKWRYVKTAILLEFEAEGWHVDWHVLLEAPKKHS